MAIKISGILKDGMGRPIPKCTIELLCKKTSLTVVVETEARIGLDITGAYDLQVEPGQYDVSLYIFGFPPKRVGEIQVYLDSRPGTLNDFLTMPDESDLTPDLVAIFQQLRNEAQQAASDHADRAELAANSVKTLTASANTLAPGTNATAQWNPDTNNLLVGVPSGLKGDKGDTGPQAQLSPLLTSISGLTTAANQLIYSNGVNAVTTTSFTALGRSIVAATNAAGARTVMGAAADSDVLKIANNLSEISTTPAKAKARSNLGLGNSAVMNVGETSSDLQRAGTGIGGLVSNIQNTSDTRFYYNPAGGAGSTVAPMPARGWGYIQIGISGYYRNRIAIEYSGATPQVFVQTMFGETYNAWLQFWTTGNTTVDANGFIKQASPVVKLFSDGSCELNNESKGVTAERLSEGVYRLSGSLMGFNSDGLWDIEVPSDDNKQPLIWVKSTVEANGDIIVKTYHRTHPNAPKFAQNVIEGYNDGDPIDIPVGRWVDLRVQVYADELEAVALDS